MLVMLKISDLDEQKMLMVDQSVLDFLVEMGIPSQHAQWAQIEWRARVCEAVGYSESDFSALIAQVNQSPPIICHLLWEILYVVLELSKRRCGGFVLPAPEAAKTVRLRVIRGDKADEITARGPLPSDSF